MKLNESLKKGEAYCLSFYLALADSSKFATGKTGVHLSKDSIKNSTQGVLNKSPHLTTSSTPHIDTTWSLIKKAFIPSKKNLNFLTIGNFNNYNNTPIKDSATPSPWYLGTDTTNGYAYYAFYYIDDVSLVSITPSLKNSDTTISLGESVQLSSISDTTAEYIWNPTLGLNNPKASNPVASPKETTTYTVTKRTHCDTT
ncbi:MAG: hypothetical protein ABEH43_07600, partial [Flavobacteriales bacterium]